MAQAVSCRLLTSEDRVRYEIYGGQSGLETDFSSQYFDFPLSVSFSQCAIRLHLHVALTSRANRRRLGTFQMTILLRESESTGHKITFTY